MNPITRWRTRRSARRTEATDLRFIQAGRLWKAGRFAEYADELARVVEAYAREPHVNELTFRQMVKARIRRCEALVRAGLPAMAESEAAHVADLLAEVDGPSGPYEQMLRRRMDAAYRGEELPDVE